MRLFMSEYVTVEPGEDGVSIITARIPSHMFTEVMELADQLLYMARFLRTKSRAAEAISKARQLRIIA